MSTGTLARTGDSGTAASVAIPSATATANKSQKIAATENRSIRNPLSRKPMPLPAPEAPTTRPIVRGTRSRGIVSRASP